MPFGLRNAAQTFKRFLDDILRNLHCFAYLDDILIASIDHASHYRDLEEVFQRLNEKGLVLNIEKCIFGADKLPFLGCEVSKDGISPSKEKVEALGKKKRGKTTIDWSEAAVQAFQTCNNSIAQAVLLAHPNSEAKLSLAVDARNTEPHGTPLHCDVSTGNIRPSVPKAFRNTIINAIHSLAHSGAKATANAVKQRFIWISLKKDCTEFCKRCIPCQKSKVSRHVKSPKGDFSLPSARFSHIHLDVFGSLPPSKSYRYCLTAVHRFTRWPETFPMIDLTANTIAENYYSGCISRFGVPEVITTDQGRNFEIDIFHSLTKYLGISKILIAAYNPAANGMVERFHR
ncbi:Retrovirus-related Pol polyprotein from transposon 17.6 [Araneus ventricosus]|uniref:RNA-directed DNA polymerase n=1 Tax=Araneus ventricosus TaxID=182803 RepID=A0A4Y2PGW5_ARAVE|nr:Retrovirus-related Pol polyprotein from transposon 17.6 [Araneus ventricosus]